MLLEETELAHAFGGDAARGDIGDRARCEIKASVGDIHFVGQDRYANRLYFRDGSIHQSEQDIQVMNHDVIHDVNIQAARRENAETMDFEVKGAVLAGP